MKNTILAFVFLNLAFLTPVFEVQAENVVRSGNEVSIADDQKIEGDFYSAAGKITISGEIAEDAVMAAGQITIKGLIGEDAFLAAGSVDVHGTVSDDLRIIAGEVTIADPVMGDLLIAASTVNILSTASISGDVILLADSVTIEGSVGGDVIGTISSLQIDGLVEGDVDVKVDYLTLGNRAEIAGSVSYVSSNLVTQALNASIAGDLVRDDPIIPVKDITLSQAITPLLVLLFASLAWYLVSRKTMSQMVKRATLLSPRPILIGLAAFIAVPLLALILALSVLGSLVSMTLMFAYLMLISLAIVGSSAVLGVLLMKVFNQPRSEVTLLALVVGAVGVGSLLLLPVLGQVILVIFFILTFGAMVDLLIRPNVQ